MGATEAESCPAPGITVSIEPPQGSSVLSAAEAVLGSEFDALPIGHETWESHSIRFSVGYFIVFPRTSLELGHRGFERAFRLFGERKFAIGLADDLDTPRTFVAGVLDGLDEFFRLEHAFARQAAMIDGVFPQEAFTSASASSSSIEPMKRDGIFSMSL